MYVCKLGEQIKRFLLTMQAELDTITSVVTFTSSPPDLYRPERDTFQEKIWGKANNIHFWLDRGK